MSISTPTILELLKTSNLLDEERIARVEKAANRVKDPKELLRALVQRQYLSRWQASQLLAGRNAFFFGKYKIIDLLGRGSLGNVYLAEHVTMNRRVALRAISRALVRDVESLERFLAHARAIAALDHPNLVHAYNADKEGDRYYLVMEYVDGQDLRRLVEAKGPLDCSLAADSIRQAAEGLAYVHAQQLIHYDIRPANLMINRLGAVKIQDLGLGRLATPPDDDSRAADAAEAGKVAARYRAPEVVAGEVEPDHRADIYSLGATFHFLLTAQPPAGSVDAEGLRALREEVPLEMAEVCTRMLASDRQSRVSSAEEVAAALARWRAPEPAAPVEASVEAAPAAVEADEDDSLRIGDISLGPPRRPGSKPGSKPGAKGRKSGGEKSPTAGEWARWGREFWSQHRRSILVGSLAGLAVVLVTLGGLWLGGVFSRPTGAAPAASAPTSADAAPPEAAAGAEPDSPVLANAATARWDEILTADLNPDSKAPKNKPSGAAEPPSAAAAEKPAATEAAPADDAKAAPAAGPQPAPSGKPDESPERPAEPPPEKPPEAAEQKAEEAPPAEAPKPANPFAELPAVVNLPELKPEPEGFAGFEIGSVRAAADAPLELALLGGDSALRSSGRQLRSFVLEKPSGAAHGGWTVFYTEEAKGQEEKPRAEMARFFRDGEKLQFQWADGADASVANYLRNCVLQLRLGEASHAMPLTAPVMAEPIAVDLAHGGGSASVAVKWLPESERLRVAVTKVEGRDGARVEPADPAPPKTQLKLAFAREADSGPIADAVVMRLVFSTRATAVDGKLQLVAPPSFRAFQGRPTNALRVQAQSALEKVERELKEQEKNRARDPQEWNRRVLLATQQQALKQDLWLIDFYEQVQANGRVHFKITSQVEGYDLPLVLVETGAAPAAANATADSK